MVERSPCRLRLHPPPPPPKRGIMWKMSNTKAPLRMMRANTMIRRSGSDIRPVVSSLPSHMVRMGRWDEPAGRGKPAPSG
eukprot:2059511-Alexandrium_andersonii.AAC.1